MHKFKLSRLFLPSALFSQVLLLLYYCFKFYKAFRQGRLDFAYGFDFASLAVFIIAVILVLLLLYRLRSGSRGVLVTLFFILSAVVMLSYDFSLPSIWPDALEDIKVGRSARDQGCSDFLRDYHTQSLMRIKQDPLSRRMFMEYAGKLRLDYEPLLDDLEFDESEEIARTRAFLHPPLWFCVLGIWQTHFGDSHLSHRVLEKIVAILYLLSLYVLLGVFLKGADLKKRLSLLFLFVLLPVFMNSAVSPKNDLILGIFVTWTLYFLFKNKSQSICIHDVMVGVAYSLAALSKLTSLTMIVPILIYYLVEFRHRSILKLIVMLLCFAALPLVLHMAYGYDMILNIITGRVSQVETKLGITFAQNIGIIVLYGQYSIGIPFVLLLLTHMGKVKSFLTRDAAVIAYSFLAFFYMYFVILYGSHVYKNLGAYLPLTVPILVHIYLNTDEKRKMTLSVPMHY